MRDATTFDRRTLLAGMAALPIAAPAIAAAKTKVDMLHVGQRMARFAKLQPGVRTYLRSEERDGAHIARDIWRRETRFETVDNVRRLRIVQRWDGITTPPSLVERDSLFEMETFRPLSHIRITTTSAGVRTTEGFMFSPGAVTGLASLTGNSRADFNVACPEPMYNFETDMEMLQTLPLAQGYAASIPYYHPAGGPPARYVWAVTGSAVLAAADGRGVDCWTVECDYNSNGASVSTFWVAKRSQQLVKMESRAPDGVKRRKTLLF